MVPSVETLANLLPQGGPAAGDPVVITDCTSATSQQLTADALILFQHERIKAQVITPHCGGKSGWTGAKDDYIVH